MQNTQPPPCGYIHLQLLLYRISAGQNLCQRATSKDALKLGLGKESAGPSHIYHVGDGDDWIVYTIVHDRIHVHRDTVLGEYLEGVGTAEI